MTDTELFSWVRFLMIWALLGVISLALSGTLRDNHVDQMRVSCAAIAPSHRSQVCKDYTP